MMHILRTGLACFAIWVVGFQAASAEDTDVLAAVVDWRIVDTEMASARLQEILGQLPVSPADADAAVAAAKLEWGPTTDLLLATIEQAASLHVPTRDLLQELTKATGAPDVILLAKFPEKLAADLSVYAGRQLARQRLYDESLLWLENVDLGKTCDPVALLFFRAACRHALWNKPELAIADLQKLLRREKELPARYRLTAKLILADLRPKGEPNPLDEVSRMMQDVGRRLDLGRSGEPVVKKEVEIIEKLDKLIEEMEKELQKQQQQQQKSSQQGGGNGGQGQSSPMQDSQIAGGNGPGDVDKKDLGARRTWGDLPPAEREDALQKFGQQLPSHYREVIEGYFRKLATEPGQK